MAINGWIIERTVDLAHPPKTLRNEQPYEITYTGDMANPVWTVHVLQDGQPVTLGGSVKAYIRRIDGAEVISNGTISGNTVTVELGGSNFGQPGYTWGILRYTDSTTNATVTLDALSMLVQADPEGTSVLDPDDMLPTLQELLAELDDMRDATAAAEAAVSFIAGEYSTSGTYSVGDYAIHSGHLYRCTTEITTAETWTPAHWEQVVFGNEVRDLKSAVGKYSTYPISGYFYSKKNGIHNGVTYTWGADGKCTVTGTASSASVNILFANETALPPGVEIGKPYILNYVTSDPNVKLSIACYIGNTIQYFPYKHHSMFVVPAGTVGMAIRLYVASGVSFATPAVVSCVDILAVDSLYEAFNNFKKAIAKYNSINLLSNGTFADGTSNGVTFSWNADMTVCTANGTNAASTASHNTIFSGQTRLPDGVVAGNDYYLKLKTSSPNLRIRIYFYVNGAYSSTVERNANAKIAVPADATGMSIFVCVPVGAAVSNATIEDIALLASETNDVLTQNNLKQYEPTGSTFSVFDDMPDMSYWIGYKSYIENGITGDVVHLVAGWSYFVYKIKQLVCIVCPAADQFYCGQIRFADSHQYWSDLTKTVGDVYNNYYTTEHYDNTYNISCSPTITTDTNNYLASTGDTTDRTGDIQTMLNTTGICRLGPGVFYVTGIDIPNLSMLIGSGNKSQIILAPSVTAGYAVKLRSYSQVKDVYIKGSASNITPTSTVGSRHGILFEGTANAENPTTFYRSKVEGCTITDFTGGGITCNNTGLNPGSSLCVCNCQIARCGAGINLQYFTEFHRITNVAAQDCYYGCIDNGGNNNFANCDFSMNKLALLIDNSTDQSRNNTHGTFSCCTFQHSDNTYSGGVPVSVGTAIKILKAIGGEVFVGCQIGYGDIEIDRSVGIRFDACNIIRMVAMRITNSPMVAFSDCTFWDAENSPLTESGNTTLKYDNCYTRLGAVFDPMA